MRRPAKLMEGKLRNKYGDEWANSAVYSNRNESSFFSSQKWTANKKVFAIFFNSLNACRLNDQFFVPFNLVVAVRAGSLCFAPVRRLRFELFWRGLNRFNVVRAGSNLPRAIDGEKIRYIFLFFLPCLFKINNSKRDDLIVRSFSENEILRLSLFFSNKNMAISSIQKFGLLPFNFERKRSKRFEIPN